MVILLGHLLLEIITEKLNLKRLSPVLPKEFEGYYDAEKYANSQKYTRENTKFQLLQSIFSTLLTVAFILLGGFNFVDIICRDFGFNTIATGLIFCGVLFFATYILNIPFSIYHTFVIEERYGFNKTTVKTFILDNIKSIIIGAIIGALALSGILYFFEKADSMAWVYSWTALTILQIVIMYLAPTVIMPLFNKFTPLEDGELKTSIENYAKQNNFALQGVFKMDGSKRTTKSNAFFTGFGRFRKIVLYDTLIENFNTEELVSILAHEVGHFKLKHIFKLLFISIISSGFMLFMMSLFIENKGLFDAFQMDYLSIYASLVFFGILYTPIQLAISVLSLYFSRNYEYQADQYAVTTAKKPKAMVEALKKLSVERLANLTPHPLKVWESYSHPPILQRLKEIS